MNGQMYYVCVKSNDGNEETKFFYDEYCAMEYGEVISNKEHIGKVYCGKLSVENKHPCMDKNEIIKTWE